MTEQLKVEKIQASAWEERGESHLYKGMFRFGTHKLKVERRRNFYAFQSWAKVSRWDGDKWHLVDSIPYPEMTADSVYHPNHQPDVDRLLQMAAAVLSN